ncbi:MAG: hypothetical protein Q7J57_16130 [Gemmobacter sp.]|nr:hypothetical protein [Gemmobacter sp.]
MTERFFATHRTKGLLLVLDSFAFYSAQWNEERFMDCDLLSGTPLDGQMIDGHQCPAQWHPLSAA